MTDDMQAFVPTERPQRAASTPPVPTTAQTIRMNRPQPQAPRAETSMIDAILPPSAPPAPARQEKRRNRMRKEVTMPSFGMIDHLMKDDTIHDILINSGGKVFIDRMGQVEDTGLRFKTEEELWVLAELIMKLSGQHWDEHRPILDTRLPDGSRINLVAPPMAVDGISVSIRKFPSMQVTLDSMVKTGQLSTELAAFLVQCVRAKLNIVIAGGTGSGKTTLLNVLSAAVPAEERIVTIEDSAELKLQQPQVVRLEAKVATAEAPNSAVTIRDLVKNALRMRPDRIIVGESRGEEAFDVLQAMNTGHDGSMTTLHANTPRDTLSRLETMVGIAAPQLPPRIVRQQIASTIHLIVQVMRGKDGIRRITHISEIAGMEGEVITMQDLVVYVEANGKRPAEYRWTTGGPRNLAITEAARASGMLRSGPLR